MWWQKKDKTKQEEEEDKKAAAAAEEESKTETTGETTPLVAAEDGNKDAVVDETKKSNYDAVEGAADGVEVAPKSDDDEAQADKEDEELLECHGCIPPSWSRQNSPIFFIFISIAATASCLMTFVGQLLPFLVLDKVELLDAALKVYVMLFTMVFVFVEMEVPWVAGHLSTLVSNWAVRGVLYSFIGLIGASEAKSVVEYRAVKGRLKTSLDSQMASFFISLASWAMVVMGLIYIVMGMLRLKSLRNQHRRKKMKESAEKDGLPQGTTTTLEV